MPFGSHTIGRAYEFDDTILGEAGSVQTIKDLVDTGKTEFTPQCVYVGTSSDEDEETAGVATINGWLAGENSGMAKSWKVYTKTTVGLAFAGINSTGTTARGIKVGSGI
jgi:hypothetical protein